MQQTIIQQTLNVAYNNTADAEKYCTMTKACCRRASHETDVAASPALLSESEASELFGDYIDEDSQTVQRVRPPSCTHALYSLITHSMHSSLAQCTHH